MTSSASGHAFEAKSKAGRWLAEVVQDRGRKPNGWWYQVKLVERTKVVFPAWILICSPHTAIEVGDQIWLESDKAGQIHWAPREAFKQGARLASDPKTTSALPEPEMASQGSRQAL